MQVKYINKYKLYKLNFQVEIYFSDMNEHLYYILCITIDQIFTLIPIWNSQVDKLYVHADHDKMFTKKDKLFTPLSHHSTNKFVIMEQDGRLLFMLNISWRKTEFVELLYTFSSNVPTDILGDLDHANNSASLCVFSSCDNCNQAGNNNLYVKLEIFSFPASWHSLA